MDIHVYFHLEEQGRLHPDDLQLIQDLVTKGMSNTMAQIDDLLADLNAITTDVANKLSEHASQVASLESQISQLQASASAGQPVDLSAALSMTQSLRSSLEGTAAAAAQASDSAQSAVDASAAAPATDTPAPTPTSDTSTTDGNMDQPGTTDQPPAA